MKNKHKSIKLDQFLNQRVRVVFTDNSWSDGRRLSCWELWKELWEKTTIHDLRVYNKPHSYSNWLIKQLEQ